MKNSKIFLATLPVDRDRSCVDHQTDETGPVVRTSLHLVRALPVRPRDRGLWLLGGASARSEGWLGLNLNAVHAAGAHDFFRTGVYAGVKRIADIFVSLLLVVLLLPVFLIVSILIKLDSPGPILFHQLRIGKDGAEFLLWKFRSMHVSAPRYAPSPTTDTDVRLTRVGRLIRRVSADELPQLINVLLGDMSLVGPRPEMPFIVARYTAAERRRLAVRPGITGLWQISSGRAHPIHHNLQYDLYYIRNRSLVLDAMILLRTLAVVLRGAGAI